MTPAAKWCLKCDTPQMQHEYDRWIEESATEATTAGAGAGGSGSGSTSSTSAASASSSTETDAAADNSFAALFQSMTGYRAPTYIRVFREYDLPAVLAWMPCSTCGKRHKAGVCALRIEGKGFFAAEDASAEVDASVTLAQAKQQLLVAIVRHQEASDHHRFLSTLKLRSDSQQQHRSDSTSSSSSSGGGGDGKAAKCAAFLEKLCFAEGTHGFAIQHSLVGAKKIIPVQKLGLPHFSEALSTLIDEGSLVVTQLRYKAATKSKAHESDKTHWTKVTINEAVLPGVLREIQNADNAEKASAAAEWQLAWKTLRPKIMSVLQKPRLHLYETKRAEYEKLVQAEAEYAAAKAAKKQAKEPKCGSQKIQAMSQWGGFSRFAGGGFQRPQRPFAMQTEQLLKLCVGMGWVASGAGPENDKYNFGDPLFWRVLLEMVRCGDITALDMSTLEPTHSSQQELVADMQPFVQEEEAAGVHPGGYGVFSQRWGGWKRFLMVVGLPIYEDNSKNKSKSDADNTTQIESHAQRMQHYEEGQQTLRTALKSLMKEHVEMMLGRSKRLDVVNAQWAQDEKKMKREQVLLQTREADEGLRVYACQTNTETPLSICKKFGCDLDLFLQTNADLAYTKTVTLYTTRDGKGGTNSRYKQAPKTMRGAIASTHTHTISLQAGESFTR
jgi:hypothetical protein